MIFLNEDIWFPPVNLADENGLLAIGGDLSYHRLKLAYQSGIFPWYSEQDPILWYSPPERMVLFLEELKISKSMAQILKKDLFKVTFNQNFRAVINQCKTIDRGDGLGTWITNDMHEAYVEMHDKGMAKSVEVWLDNKLVGGLYGIDLGKIFCGESMFSKVSNASKIGLIALVEHLKSKQYALIDCQVYNKHLASLGAKEIPRLEFIKILKKSM